MELPPNAFVTGLVGFLSGDLLGSAVNRFSKVLLERINLGTAFGTLGPSTGIIEKMIGTAFHVGLLSVGAELLTNALPWLTTEPSAYSMFILGLVMTNESLRANINFLNRAFWLPSVPPSIISADQVPAAAAAAAAAQQ